MFTGLVEAKGRIDSFEKNEDGMILRLNHDNSFNVEINDSVSCDGVCLTVISKDKNFFTKALPMPPVAPVISTFLFFILYKILFKRVIYLFQNYICFTTKKLSKS